jgi:hypothetical protein
MTPAPERECVPMRVRGRNEISSRPGLDRSKAAMATRDGEARRPRAKARLDLFRVGKENPRSMAPRT